MNHLQKGKAALGLNLIGRQESAVTIGVREF